MTKLALSLIATGALTLAMAATAQSTPAANSNAQTNKTQVQRQTPATPSLPAQIKKIQNAPAQQRVELMNQLKERIATMSPDERREAMQQLHTQMRNEAANEHAQDQKMMEKVEEMLTEVQEHKEQMQEHAQEMQQNVHGEMERNEHMNQREAGEQYREQMQGHVENLIPGRMETSNPQGNFNKMEGPMGRH